MIFSTSLNGLTELTNDLVLMIFLALFTVISVTVGVWFVAANINKPEKDTLYNMKAVGVVWLFIIVGFGIRVAFSLITVGYLGVNPTGLSASSGGLLELYRDAHNVVNGAKFTSDMAYPVVAYIALFFGKILDLFGALPLSPTATGLFVFRLPFMLADAAAAFILFKIGKKYANSFVGIGLAAIYSLCPVFFFSSGLWGSAMSIFALFILLALYYMTEKSFLGITVAFGLALLTAKEAVYFLPVFAVFYVYYFIKAYKANRGENSLGIKELFMHKERGLVLRLPIYLVTSLALLYILSLPKLSDVDYSFFSWFNLMYLAPFTKVTEFGRNAFSIYNLFNRNNAEINSAMPIWIISLGFMVIATALVYVLYTSKKNRANMVLVAGYVLLTLAIYSMGFWELSLMPLLAILLLAFVLVKDRRIMHVFGLLALVVVLNGSAVMMTTGYFSGDAISAFASSTGTALLSKSTFGTVVNIVCTVVTILTHLYFTIVVLDVSISNKRLQFEPKNDSFGATLKNWFTFK